MISAARRTYRNYQATVAFFPTILCLVLLGVTTNATVPNVTSARIDLSSQALVRFTSSHSMSDLRSAVDALDGTIDIGALTPGNFIGTRRTIVGAYARVLKAIEQSYDHTFDPSNIADLPEVCVKAPENLPSCADPMGVKNAQARAAYLAAIQANALKAKRAARYQQLHNLDQGAMVGLSMSLDLLRK
ncbi:MAG TPA: hypothetical protein VFH72_06615, partial [Candidatus Baltobacteraceae bacterium]|nr:hypothetical protein [Candidatus Baltobacteraceae bacterium]